MAEIVSALKNKIPRIYFLFLYVAGLLLISSLPYVFKIKNASLFSVSALFIYVAVVELLFRVSFRIIFKKPYSYIPKLPFDKMYIEPHPYLPYVYKQNFLSQKSMPSRYPLHQEKGYSFSALRSNNRRHSNGPGGDRDIDMPKPEGLIRINCLGASTTGNYICYNGKNYSYPMELEKILKEAFPDVKIEVNNCGVGGYTSAEILIKFLLDTIDTKPDIVVIYHAYNDLGSSLTSCYQSDYSHAKKNLGEVYYLYRLASKIPEIRLASLNFLMNYCLFSQNIRFSLLETTSRGKIELENDFQGLSTYGRNIEHIINVCKANKIQVILSTFSQHLYLLVQNDERCLKYHEGVDLENNVMRNLAVKHNLPLVDNAHLVPKEDKYFVDTVHFTPEGMHLIAENISHPIIEFIKTYA